MLSCITMFRRVLTYLVIVGIAAFGYQPASAAMLAMNPAMDMQMTAPSSVSDNAAMPDCAGMHKPTEQQQLPCEFDGSCAARCHLNSALGAISFEPLAHVYVARTSVLWSASAQTQIQPGPHFRPPIL